MAKRLKHGTSINLAERYLWFECDDDAVLFKLTWEDDGFKARLQ